MSSQEIVNATLTPAYGRDYKTKAEAVQAFREGKDWVINNVASRYDGRMCSIRDCVPGNMVKLRYKNRRQVAFYTVTESDLR